MDHPQESTSHSHDDDEVIKWTDDCIRWTEEENIEHKQEDDAAVDIFKCNPMETFSFRFPRPNTENSFISIELQGYKVDSDEVWKSTGLTLWKASEHMCHYLVNNHDKLFSPYYDKRILELGAGLGLVGIVAYNLAGNNSTVCLTDGDTDALVCLRHNVQHNTSSNTKISSHQLLWGHETAEAFLKKHNNKTFDIVFASDILYAKCVIEPLWETVKILLSRPNGIFVMAFATRAVKVTIDDFIEAAKGFKCQCVEETDGVFVYEFGWKEE